MQPRESAQARTPVPKAVGSPNQFASGGSSKSAAAWEGPGDSGISVTVCCTLVTVTVTVTVLTSRQWHISHSVR